jgi:phosphoserine phosphatase
VDLDGTLIAGDMLWESGLQVARTEPLGFLRLLVGSRGEKGRIKAALAGRAVIAPERLAWNEAVLDFLRAARAHGRSLWLATASDERLAQVVADHLGLFDRVMGSVPGANCKGWAKRQRIEAAAGAAGYDYIGDSGADLPIFAGAHRAWVVGPAAERLRAVAHAGGPVPETVGSVAGRWARVGYILRMARPRQWLGNGVVFLPLLFAGRLSDPAALGYTALAFAAFCLTLSSIGIGDDLLDAEHDRQDPRKAHRPIAAGEVVPGLAVWTTLVLLGLGLVAGAVAGWGVFALLLVHLVLGVVETRLLKQRWTTWVPALVGLYTLRIWAGAVAAGAIA